MTAGLVGLVLVSHSVAIAQGLVQLAGQMAPRVSVVGAGGTDDGGLGTSFDQVTAALSTADTGQGVVVLCDLGSAVLTAELARELLDEAVQERVRIVDAPLVEGAVAAAVAAEIGGDLAAVAAAAAAAAHSWREQVTLVVAESRSAESAGTEPAGTEPAETHTVTRTVTLINRDGLHARPAADFVRLASTFDAQISVNGQDATSLLGIMGLGLTTGRAAELVATGEQAQQAVQALAELIESGFGEP